MILLPPCFTVQIVFSVQGHRKNSCFYKPPTLDTPSINVKQMSPNRKPNHFNYYNDANNACDALCYLCCGLLFKTIACFWKRSLARIIFFLLDCTAQQSSQQYSDQHLFSSR